MSLIINKTLNFKGKVSPPSSKSHSIRAIILASLCQGKSVLNNLLNAEDTKNALNICQALGAEFNLSENNLTINSNDLPLRIANTELNSGNSGITTHFIMPLLGLRSDPNTPVILNCLPQMRDRPISSLVTALKNLGMKIEYLDADNKLPLSISGSLIGGNTEVDGTTSQYLSALLFALPCAQKDSKITVKNLTERPYVEMTLKYLNNQNIKYLHHYDKNTDTDFYEIKGQQQYKNFTTTIPSDFSSASYIIAAAVMINSEVILENIDIQDPQGDKELINILQAMGADIKIESTTLHIRGGKPLNGIKIDAKDIPDLLPTLAIIGTYASGQTEIYNIGHARIKETDRLHSMATGLRSLGAKLEIYQDKIIIYNSQLQGCSINSYNDHRTVMAFAVAGMIADGTTVINNYQAINKTFPTFVQTMQSLGANMQIKINKHIILMGFKNVGKSVTAKHLAEKLCMPFIDTDQKIELYYNNKFNKNYNCREIVDQHGIDYFRELEHTILSEMLAEPCSVIALGGGVPLNIENQKILQSSILIHITADKDTVFDRIISNGRPAFINSSSNIKIELEKLWLERANTYQKLANITVLNNGPISNTADRIITRLSELKSVSQL